MQDQENRPDTTEADRIQAVRNEVAKRLELVKNGFTLMLVYDGIGWNFQLVKINEPNRGIHATLPCAMYTADTLADVIKNHHLGRP